MPRLFAGLELPGEIKQKLLGIEGGIAGASWQTFDQLHLTLRFIGFVDDETVTAIRQALGNPGHEPMQLALAGIGCFGAPSQPRVLWAGVEPQAPVTALHHEINDRLLLAGIQPEQRPFRPHITLVRFKPGAGPCQDFLQQHSDFSSPPFEIREISLFSSTPTAMGSRYQAIARFPLGE